MSRLEDARRLANTNPRDTFVSPNLWQAHMHELLERIEHLQRENEQMRESLRFVLDEYEREFEANSGPDGRFPDHLVDTTFAKARRLSEKSDSNQSDTLT